MQQPTTTNDFSPENIWERQKAKLRAIFPALRTEDLQYDYGMKEVMLTKLQTTLKISREELTYLMARL